MRKKSPFSLYYESNLDLRKKQITKGGEEKMVNEYSQEHRRVQEIKNEIALLEDGIKRRKELNKNVRGKIKALKVELKPLIPFYEKHEEKLKDKARKLAEHW